MSLFGDVEADGRKHNYATMQIIPYIEHNQHVVNVGLLGIYETQYINSEF